MPRDEAVMVPGTILVVEDDVMVLTVIADELREAGLHVVEASDFAEALSVLDTQPIDLILTDLKMPGTMTGLDLADAVRARFPGIKIALMTGMVPDNEPLRSFDLLLRKPFNIEAAADTFKTLLCMER